MRACGFAPQGLRTSSFPLVCSVVVQMPAQLIKRLSRAWGILLFMPEKSTTPDPVELVHRTTSEDAS